MLTQRKIKNIRKAEVILIILYWILFGLLTLARPTFAATCANPCVTQFSFVGGDPARAYNIVYVSQGFSSGNIASYQSFVSQSSFFLHPSSYFVPFNKYPSYFNVYRVDQYGGIDDGLTAEAIAALPNIDQLIYVKNRGGRDNVSIYTGDIVLYLASACSGCGPIMVTAHEMGHALGKLGDEYVDSGYCPSGVYTGGEPLAANLTINTDIATLKWKQWLGVQGTGLVTGGAFCSSGIYHPVNAIMTAGNNFWNYTGTYYGPYGPVNNEELVYRINQVVHPIISQTPSETFQSVPDTQQTIQLSAQVDPAFLPQGTATTVQWYRYDDPYNYGSAYPIPNATSNTLLLDLTTIPTGQMVGIRMAVLDPDINAYHRRTDPVVLGQPLVGRAPSAPLSGTWLVGRNIAAPNIDSISVQSGTLGTLVGLSGTNFCFSQCNSTNSTETWISVGGGTFTSPAIVWQTYLNFYLPKGSYTGPITVQIRSPSGQVISQTTTNEIFNVTLPTMRIDSITPSSGSVGTPVSLQGVNFCNAQCNTASSTETFVKAGNFFTASPSWIQNNRIDFILPPNISGGGITPITVKIRAPDGSVATEVTSTAQFTVIPPLIAGDLNADGLVDVADVALADRIALGLVVPTADQIMCGDVAPAGSPDGAIRISDIARIRRKAMGLESF